MLKLTARLRRIPPSRGFGIQSPWAYHLMVDVIARRQVDDKLKHLAAAHPDQTHSERRRHELTYRLARRFNTTGYCDATDDFTAADYAFAHIDGGIDAPSSPQKDNKKMPAIIYHTEIESDQLGMMAAAANSRSLMIIDGIRRSKAAYKQWIDFRNSAVCGITFDLYNLALVFFDHKITKQHYKGPCY